MNFEDEDEIVEPTIKSLTIELLDDKPTTIKPVMYQQWLNQSSNHQYPNQFLNQLRSHF
jgi:hypothetical protein